MRSVEVSISNDLLNMLYGSFLFWIYLFFLRDVNQLRQVGSIPAFSSLLPILIYFILKENAGISNSAVLVLLIMNSIAQIWIGREFRKEYKKIIKKEFWDGIKNPVEHNVSVIKTIGYSVDNAFLGLILFAVAVFLQIGGTFSLVDGNYQSAFTYYLISLLFLFFLHLQSNKLELTGTDFEKAVDQHYKTANTWKKILKPVKLLDKM